MLPQNLLEYGSGLKLIKWWQNYKYYLRGNAKIRKIGPMFQHQIRNEKNILYIFFLINKNIFATIKQGGSIFWRLSRLSKLFLTKPLRAPKSKSFHIILLWKSSCRWKKAENARMSIFRPCNNRVFCVRIFADMKEKERYDLKGKRDLNELHFINSSLSPSPHSHLSYYCPLSFALQPFVVFSHKKR